MRKCFLFLVSVLLLMSACISERAKEDEQAGKKGMDEFVTKSKSALKANIRKTLRRYRVKQKFLEEGSVQPGVQYVYLRMLKELI